MSTLAEVHVGDVGTHYKGHILDADDEFDPTSATSKVLIWKTPSGIVERAATVTTEGVAPNQQWFLNYTVVAADIADGLHKLRGSYLWQGYVEFADGTRYHTSVNGFNVGGNLN